jgi:hypothetical protein
MTQRDAKLHIFKMLRPLIRAPDISSKLQGTEDDDQILNLEYKHFFEEGDEKDDPIYKVQIHNNLRFTEPGLFYNSKPMCEFCNTEHKDDCDFSFKDENKTVRDIKQKIKYSQRPSLVLSVVWRSNPKANLSLFDKREIIAKSSEKKDVASFFPSSSQITL